MNVSVYLFSFLGLWKIFHVSLFQFMPDQYLSSTGNKIKIVPDKF